MKQNKRILKKKSGLRKGLQGLYPELAHLYKRLIDFTGDGVYRYSMKTGRILTANEGLVKILDLRCHPRDLVGKKMRNLLIYTEKPGVVRDMVRKKGEIHNYLYHFKTLKGEDRWVIHDSFLSSTLENGEPVVDAIVKDITRRKMAEDAVRALEARHATTLKSIGDAVIATDLEGRVTFLNEVASKLTGWNESAAKGKPLKKVFHIVSEMTGKPAKNPVDRVLREGVVVGLANHTELIARNGTRIPIDDSAAPIKDSQGKLVGVVLVFHDVTESRRVAKALQENAEKFRTVANFTYDWEFWNDPQGRAIYVSPACEKVTGRKYQDFFADPGLRRRLIHPDDLARFDRHVRVCEKARKPGEGEWRQRHSDGSYRWIAHACRPVFDSRHQYCGVRGGNRDITERKKAEHDLEASETRYRRLFESAKDGILILHPRTNEILDANPFILELLGYSRSELIGKKRWEIGDIKDIPKIKAIFRQILKKGSVRYEDLPLRAKDGRLIPIEFVSNVYKVDNETVIQCNIRDITQRKMAEDALREAEYQKALVLDNTTEIIARHDLDHKIQWANEAYLKATGLSLPEIQGHKCYRMWGLDRLCKNCPVTLAIKTGKPQFTELTPENQPHWPEDQGSWLVRAAPVRDAKGRVVGAIETAIDITRQRQAEKERQITEARLATTLKSIGDAVIATDVEGRVTFLNAVASKLTGWKQEEARGKPLKKIFKIFNETTGKQAKNPVEKVIREGVIVGLANHTVLIAKDGSRIPIDDSAAPIKDEKGKFIGVVLVFHDIIERRIAEAEQAGLISMVSHELRTPLYPIREGIAMLRGDEFGKINEEQRNILNVCHLSIERLVRLISNFLEYQKFEVGVAALGAKMTDLNEIVLEAQKEMELMAKHKGIFCRVDLAKDLPRIPCDRDKILRVVINLISNAIKFTERGEIVVQTVRQASSIRVSIIDTGIGIRSKDIPSLFQKFVQLEDGKQISGGGTGLGLMISKKIIEAHKGKIGVNSDYQKGSVFYFTLPILGRSSEDGEGDGRA